MHNKTWKKEWNLLEEAYGSVNETTHSGENSCKDDEYFCQKDKVCKPKGDVQEEAEQGVTNAASEGLGLSNKELGIHADRPGADEELPEPGEVDEAPLSTEVLSLIDKLAGPQAATVEELQALAREGRLSEYVDLIVTKKDLAQKELDLQKPKEIES